MMKHLQCGFTLMDLLVGMLMASILSLIAMNVLTENARITMQETSHASALADANQVYRIIEEFIKQAEICLSCTPAKTFDITYGNVTNPNPDNKLSLANDSITLDFLLPYGYKIWPNDKGQYDVNAVRLAWDNTTGIITIANAADKASLGSAIPQNLVQVTKRSSRILNIDVWPLNASGGMQSAANDPPSGGYKLCVAAKPPISDYNYTNPDDSGEFLHYRTAKICGIVSPRNW